ncbi:MAG: prepilin-type N-terminal cleavage/methylation domain-containing protein [Planctomycetes bacterium]|nr:prepilin-type N-terminal cleavage/methylation domain-containing protein [Planctomycetota bacterium]
MVGASRRRGGFTLLEVLIALVVLVVGILGILALVPTAVRTAGDAVDDLVAAQQAHSVVAALRLGARDLYHEAWVDTPDGRRLAHAFFLFPHPAATPPGQPPPAARRPDGAIDPAIFDHPACILLPHGTDASFVYPRATPIAAENGQGDAAAARDDMARAPGEPLVRRAYGGPAAAADGTPLPGYAFALLVQRASVDGARVDGLYRVTVLLYHGFGAWDPASPTDEPAPMAMYTTELMVGPMSIPAVTR